ncbi:MAG: hypothetical protein KDE27_29475 [Planctomycetes bacterium]|nr:hypothetical protein [Planctomycetota bacterium]
MSTTPDKKPDEEPASPAHPPIVDEQTGVYGWFRRNQKALLYSVGLFVLITFSVSGPMLAAVKSLFEKERAMPTMVVGKEKVTLEPADYSIGQAIASRLQTLQGAKVLPYFFSVGEGGRTDAADVFAMLRRAAITEGIEPSYTEVDRVIGELLQGSTIQSPTQLARQNGFGSLAEFEMVLAEALRIGTLIHIESLALDSSEASILQKVIGDREKVACRVASFDEAARADDLKANTEITYEDLTKWLDAKELADKQRMQVFAPNQIALNIGAILYADFDRAQWVDDYLKDFTVGEEELTKLYNAQRKRFEQEDGTFKALEDEGVKDDILQRREIEEILKKINTDIRNKKIEFEQPKRTAFSEASTEVMTAQNNKATAEKEVADKPEDEAAKQRLFEATQLLEAKELARDEAKAAMEAAQGEFDFLAAFHEFAKDRAGVVTRSFDDPRAPEALKDLDAGDLGLGTWENAQMATNLTRVGDIGYGPVTTDKAGFVYAIKAAVVRPLKSQEELEPLLEGAYFNEKAKTEAEEKKTKMEDELLRLAKAKMPEKVQEIEGKRDSRIDEQISEWEADMQKQVEHAQGKLAETRPETAAQAAWDQKLTELNSRLAAKESRREEITKEVDEAIAAEIGEEAKKFHREVLDEAAAAAGFTVADVGPLPRDVAQRPRFDKRYDKKTVFLYRNHAELDENDSTGMLHDTTDRLWLVAVCTQVAPLDRSDIERREFEGRRQGGYFRSFALDQANMAFQQAWTREALEKRYKVERPIGEQSEPQPGDNTPGDKPADDKPTDK